MTITLRIDNMDSLPDGGPLVYQARGQGFEIGRESHLDWALPDPNRVISGRHCEIRFENGAYWLNDVSRNGTFVNGATGRVKSPYRLADGDKIQIGHYLISVSLGAADQASPFGGEEGTSGRAGGDAIWDTGSPAPAPIARRDLMPPPKRGRRDADFSEQFLEMPDFRSPAGADPFATPASPQPAPFGGASPFDPPASPFGAPAAPAGPPPVATPRPVPSMPPANPFGGPPAGAPDHVAQGFGAVPPPFAPLPSGGHPASAPFVESEPFAPLRPAAPVPAAAPPPATPSPYGQPGQGYQPQPAYQPPAPQPFSPPPPAPAFQPAPPPAPSYAPPQQASAPVAYSEPGRPGADLLERIAAGAGVPADVFRQRNPAEVAEEIGHILRLVVEELTQLLKARAAAKVMAKSSNRTMISAVDNNPLKFMPRPEEALEVMFARRRQGYLDARRSVEDSFKDLKTHEFATYAAMQKALARLLEDLAPEAIEKKVSGSAFASKKARAWDTFVATWEAKSEAGENGMLDVFLAHFADAYEKASKKG